MANQGPKLISPVEVLQRAPRIFTMVNPGTQSIVDNGLIHWELPRTGLGCRMVLSVRLSVTVAGTVTSGTIAAQAPYNAIKNIKFGPNGNIIMRNHSGWGAYKHNRIRECLDPLSDGATNKFASNSQTSLGVSSTNRPVPLANIAATTYVFNLAIPLPIAYNQAGEEALLKLQNETIYSLDVQIGNLVSSLSATGGTSDIFTSLVGTGLSYTVSGQMSLGLEYFRWLDDRIFDYSDQTNSFLAVLEQQFPLVAGNNYIQPPRTDVFTMLIFEVIGNGGTPVPDAKITNQSLTYANSMQLWSSDRYTALVNDYFMHNGLAPMDGVWAIDLGLRSGVPDRRDIFDSINNRNIVDFTLGVQIDSSQNMSGGYGMLTYEALVDANG